MDLRTLSTGMVALLVLVVTPWAHAISEENYEQEFRDQVVPLMEKGVQFCFPSADGKHELCGFLLPHPDEKGLIVVMNGRSESWIKYGELFHDLYAQGYSVASYDQRGQGLSPRLLPGNPQIGEIDNFGEYARDLGAFVEYLKGRRGQRNESLFLLAHSMGAAVAVDYLARHPSTFRAVAFTSPMFRINTAPYPEPVAALVLHLLHGIGLGTAYAPGEHDRDPSETFESNRITSSHARWQAISKLWESHRDTVVAGASCDWVLQSIQATRRIRDTLASLKSKILILQSGKDQLVINEQPPSGANFTSLLFPGARHEILMESDPIRQKAIAEILRFFKNTP
jgi:lysophospholipase